MLLYEMKYGKTHMHCRYWTQMISVKLMSQLVYQT